MFTTNVQGSGKPNMKPPTGNGMQIEMENLDLFGIEDEQLSPRNRSIIARNREWQKICLMMGKEFVPMKLELGNV